MALKYILGIIFSFTLLTTTAAQASMPEPIGVAARVIKDVSVLRHDQQAPTPLALNAPIYLGDTIITANEESFVRVDFIDETHITMNGEESELTIDKYIFDPKKVAEGSAKFTILKGSFEFVGGLLDKGAEENVQIDLDFGSIGVRGTKILRSMKDNECWIYLEEGSIRVFNEGGSVDMKPGDGTRISSKLKAPHEVAPWKQKNIDWIKRVTKMPE